MGDTTTCFCFCLCRIFCNAKLARLICTNFVICLLSLSLSFSLSFSLSLSICPFVCLFLSLLGHSKAWLVFRLLLFFLSFVSLWPFIFISFSLIFFVFVIWSLMLNSFFIIVHFLCLSNLRYIINLFLLFSPFLNTWWKYFLCHSSPSVFLSVSCRILIIFLSLFCLKTFFVQALIICNEMLIYAIIHFNSGEIWQRFIIPEFYCHLKKLKGSQLMRIFQWKVQVTKICFLYDCQSVIRRKVVDSVVRWNDVSKIV